MSDHLLETIPLRDKFREAERIARELSSHLEQGFLPKVHDARKLTRPASNADEVADATIRAAVESVLVSHEYTIVRSRNLERFLNSIERDIERILAGNDSLSTPTG